MTSATVGPSRRRLPTQARSRERVERILDAAARFLAEGRGGEDAKDMITESIGYADAVTADVILQYAVLGEIVYG